MSISTDLVIQLFDRGGGKGHLLIRYYPYPFSPYLFIICLDYVLRSSIDKIKENCFKLTEERCRKYPAKTITDVDDADDIALLASALAQAKTLLHNLE